VDDSATKQGNILEEAIHLIGEMDENYRSQLKQLPDAGVSALLEALKMLHESSGKKLKARASEGMRSS
jgi:hypothetical protein